MARPIDDPEIKMWADYLRIDPPQISFAQYVHLRVNARVSTVRYSTSSNLPAGTTEALRRAGAIGG